jgi:hypothetical protein
MALDIWQIFVKARYGESRSRCVKAEFGSHRRESLHLHHIAASPGEVKSERQTAKDFF